MVDGGNARSATSSSGSKTCTDKAQSSLSLGRGASVLTAGKGEAGSPVGRGSCSLWGPGGSAPWGCGRSSPTTRHSQGAESKLYRVGLAWPPWACSAQPVTSRNKRGARKRAPWTQLLPAHGLGASAGFPETAGRTSPPGAATARGHRDQEGCPARGEWDRETRASATRGAPGAPFPFPWDCASLPRCSHRGTGTGSSTYHGEGFPRLLEQRLGEQGDVHALGHVHRPAVQVCDNNIELEAAGQA